MRSDKLMKPSRVASALDCGVTQAKYKMRTVLGGWYEPGMGWRCTERAVHAFIAKRAQEGACAYQSSSEQQKPDATGTATSARPMEGGSSERSTSGQTAHESQSAPQSPPTGKSKHAQQLDKLIAQSRKQHSRKPAAPSSQSKRTPE